MRLSNLSKKESIVADAEIADTEFSRMRGLMFREKIIPILFIFGSPGIYQIHSYFVKGEFDAIYISEGKVVTEVFRNIPPGTPLVTPKEKAKYLLELPVALTDRLAIKVGDRLDFVDGK